MNQSLCPETLEQSMPVIVSLAHSIIRERNVPLEIDELIHAGIVGLAEAAARFDGSGGRNLMTFAYWRIRGAMLDAIADAAPVRRSAWRAGFRHPVSLDAKRKLRRRLLVSTFVMEDVVDRQRELETLADAMDDLSTEERNLVFMRYVQDRTLTDIGRELGVSKSWVSRLHTRMIQKLRDSLCGHEALAAA